MSRSARQLAESSRFEAVRENVASAYALRDRIQGDVVRYPHELNGYRWLFQLVARAEMVEEDKDAPAQLEIDPPPSCPSPISMGKIHVCVLHPDARDLVAVQLGDEAETWYLVSDEYFREQSVAAHGDP